jgi:hypothetical protein
MLGRVVLYFAGVVLATLLVLERPTPLVIAPGTGQFDSETQAG